MPTVRQLHAETLITLGLMGGSETAKRQYPDNEWGFALKHYDAHVEWFRVVRMETKEEAVRRDTIMQRYPEKGDINSWAKWHENNPNLPSIPYHESTHEAMTQALKFFQDPPEPIRDCLVHLAEGNELVAEDLFVFLQTYAEFIAAAEILYSWNPYVDPLKNQRAAWNKTNKDRWKHFAGLQIKKLMKEHNKGIEEAKAILAYDVRDALEGKRPIPQGWTRDEYADFLVNSKNPNPRLKNSCGGSLTREELDQFE